MRWGFCVFPSRLFVHTLSYGANPCGFRRLRTFSSGFSDGFRGFRWHSGASCISDGFGHYCSQSRVARALLSGALAFEQARVVSSLAFACELRNSRTNPSALVQTATLQPERRRSLPNRGFIPELRRAFSGGVVLVQLRKFFPNGGALAGLACPRGRAWRT